MTGRTAKRRLAAGTSLATLLLTTGWAFAADLPARPLAVAVPETCKATISQPSFGGIIKQNPNPACLTINGFGDLYFGGALSGYAYTTDNPFQFLPSPLPNDRADRVDFTNLMAYVQKVDGPFQFFVQAGGYAIPGLGFPNVRSVDQTRLLFTPLPVAYGKFVINDSWSIQGGRMPTLIGSELPFTFQNLNIQRGLLFGQENVINHGVQLNYSDGPISVSVAGTDGFFSNELSWFTGAVTYKLDDSNSFGINGGLNLGSTNVLKRGLGYQFATPLFQQNSGILSVNYTYTNGPVTITPYFQFTNVERDIKIGILTPASTYGGAVLASYAFNDNLALAGRVEYEEQTGVRGSGTTSLLFGAGSSAFSFTITPTYTVDRFFLRGEYSHIELSGITRDLTLATVGTGFGRTGNKRSQDRFMIETGITF